MNSTLVESNGKALDIKKNKLDLEHSDLLEARNAVYLLEVTLIGIVISLLSGVISQLGVGSLLAVGAGAVSIVIVELKRTELNRRLRETRNILDTLLTQ